MISHTDEPSGSRAIIERVRAFVRAESLWHPGDKLLIAVSGGPDSVALLHLLQTAFAYDEYLALVVAHVHHGLRDAAEGDAAFVEHLAGRYGLPFLQRWVDVPARVAETGASVETAAREMRYAALQDLARDTGADAIVTGHTADDQAETVLMRVLRGTGLTGLAGIPPRRGNIVRPLLPVWRHEIEAYLREHALTFRTDETNLTTEFTRNRIRLELLPHLEEAYAPGLRGRLHHLAELAREENASLEQWTDALAATKLMRVPDGVAVVPDPSLPRAMQWRLWRRAISEVCGSLENISYDHIMAIQSLQPNEQVHLPGVQVIHEAGRLVFLAAPGVGEAPTRIEEQPLPVPGRLCLFDVGCCLSVEEIAGVPQMAAGEVALLDADAVEGSITVRSWQPGDRFRPFGAPGTRKLQDIFVDAGVPRRLRERIPVIFDNEGIVWLAGFRPADRVKIVPATTRTLRITIEWELNPWTLKRSDVKL